jgi:3-keto-L-gulonate-6-phosphate decarboxylase
VGRAITGAADPAQAASDILGQISQNLSESNT